MILFLLLLLLFVHPKLTTLNFCYRKKIYNAWKSALLLKVEITEISKRDKTV